MIGESGFQRHKQDARRLGPGVAVEIDHWHDELEFNLVLGGHGTYFVPNGHFDLVPGTLVWLLPGQRHRLMRSPDFDIWVVTIDPRNLGAKFLDDIGAHACCLLATEDVIALDRLLSHVSQDMNEPGLCAAGLEYAVRSAGHISVNTSGPVQHPPHPAVLKALSVLRDNMEVPSLTALARMCGVSSDYLGQLLVSQTGRGFVEWRNRIRLERFQVLYPESRNLLTAALAAGFGSYTQFHRIFVELIGATPGEWAKSGGHPGTGALSPVVQLSAGADRPGIRMIWYQLNEFGLPTIARLFGAGFAATVQKRAVPTGAVSEAGPDCGHFAAGAFAVFMKEIVAEVFSTQPETAQAVARLSTRHDLLEDYITTFGNFGFSMADLSEMVGLYVALAEATANDMPLPARKDITGVITHIRHALYTVGVFDAVSLPERQRVVAALILQMMFLRGAYLAGRSSGSQALMKRVSDGAHRCALDLFGLDLRSVRLLQGQPVLSRRRPRAGMKIRGKSAANS